MRDGDVRRGGHRLPVVGAGAPAGGAGGPLPSVDGATAVLVDATGSGARGASAALAEALAARGVAAEVLGPRGEPLRAVDGQVAARVLIAPTGAALEVPAGPLVVLLGALGPPTEWSPAARALRDRAALRVGALERGLAARLAALHPWDA